MTQVYFHRSNAKKVFVDRCGALVNDLAEARDHATRLVQSFTSERSLEDWRDWVVATTRVMNSSSCPSLSCSASRIR